MGKHNHPEITLTGIAMHHALDAWDRGDRAALRAIFAADDVPGAAVDLLSARPRFRRGQGRTLIGFPSPGDWGGADFVPPVILHEGRHLALLNEAHQPTDAWLVLASTPEQIFPVTATPDVTVGGNFVSRLYDREGHDPRRKPAKRGGIWRRVLGFLDSLGDGH